MKNDKMNKIEIEDLRTAIELLGGQTAVSKRLEIPYRTIQNWYSGTRTPPPYVARMIIEIAITEDEAQNIIFDKERELEALAGTEERHSMSAENEELEKLRNQNETLKNQYETLWNQYEVLQEQFNTMFEIAEKRWGEIDSCHAAISQLEKALNDKIEELERERKARATWARQAGTLTK